MPRLRLGPARLVLAFLSLGLLLSSFSPVSEVAGAELPPSGAIAYLDRANRLWISQDNGQNPRPVSETGDFTDAVWSPDGSRLAATGPQRGTTGVYLASLDSGFGFRPLAAGSDPTWSPDSTRLATIASGVIKIFDREGTFVREAAVGAATASWSPDGRRIGFTRVLEDPYATGCPVRQLGWLDGVSGQTGTLVRSVGTFAWGSGGSELFYVSADDGWIDGIDLSTNRSRRLSYRRANPCGGPFFTSAEGTRLFFLDYGAGGDDLVMLDLATGQERVFADLPVGFPADELPRSYVTVDPMARYAYLVRAYPTTVTRLDLQSGARTTLLQNDGRTFLAFSGNHERLALVSVPFGQPTETALRQANGPSEANLLNVGWVAWQPSPITGSSVRAWGQTWDREDRPVAAGVAARTWVWGPGSFDAREEPYDNAPNGTRPVRYFDKSRMEITEPYADASSRWYVTNGLLARELISGGMQMGDSRTVQREPASIPVAGDPDDTAGPLYASLRGILGVPATPQGWEIRYTIDRAGNVGHTGPPGVFAAQLVPETNHTVADVFWAYLQSEGQVWNGSQFVNGKLFEPTFFATGYPITEPYWARVKVAGQVKDVLVQCFERRCLTYTSDNPEGWKVEMGNVGRHYFTWRYGSP